MVCFFCLAFACVQASVVFLFFYLKEAWPKAPNEEQPVVRAECFGEGRGTDWQLNALEVPDYINLKREQSFKKLTC